MPSGLSATEQDLVRHVQNGYQLETDSVGGDPLLRRLKDSEVIRPLSGGAQYRKGLGGAWPHRARRRG
jgi:hypothetical protein